MTYRSLSNCPNCWREFYPNARHDEFCPECWRAWTRNDGTFEARKVPLSVKIAEAVAALEAKR